MLYNCLITEREAFNPEEKMETVEVRKQLFSPFFSSIY